MFYIKEKHDSQCDRKWLADLCGCTANCFLLNAYKYTMTAKSDKSTQTLPFHTVQIISECTTAREILLNFPNHQRSGSRLSLCLTCHQYIDFNIEPPPQADRIELDDLLKMDVILRPDLLIKIDFGMSINGEEFNFGQCMELLIILANLVCFHLSLKTNWNQDCQMTRRRYHKFIQGCWVQSSNISSAGISLDQLSNIRKPQGYLTNLTWIFNWRIDGLIDDFPNFFVSYELLIMKHLEAAVTRIFRKSLKQRYPIIFSADYVKNIDYFVEYYRSIAGSLAKIHQTSHDATFRSSMLSFVERIHLSNETFISSEDEIIATELTLNLSNDHISKIKGIWSLGMYQIARKAAKLSHRVDVRKCKRTETLRLLSPPESTLSGSNMINKSSINRVISNLKMADNDESVFALNSRVDEYISSSKEQDENELRLAVVPDISLITHITNELDF